MNIMIKKNNKKTKHVFGTREWASCNLNFINGCKHDCKYCYSKEMAIRFHRKTSTTWKEEVIRKTSLNKKYKKKDGVIMFPSSHDIHPDNLIYTIHFLINILSQGNNVLIVSKPHLTCIKEICNNFQEYKAAILFRFTIGSSNNKTLKFWEPGAPSYTERIKSLKYAFENGFSTSISCEPMLDGNIERVINDVLPFVTDSIWIGKANFLLRRLKMNGEDDELTLQEAHQLLEMQSDEKIIELYNTLKHYPKLKWKESIKSIVGIEIPAEIGLDI